MISFSQILQKLKEVFGKMIGAKSIENVLRVTPTVSAEMQDAIQLWKDMYTGHSPWLREPTYNDPTRIASLGLAQMIAREKARTALLEFESEITTPMKEVETDREDADNIVERFKQSNTDVSKQETTNNTTNKENSENNASTQSQNNFNQFSKYNTSQFHPQATVKQLVPKGPTERAEYLNKTYQNKLIPQLNRQFEYGIALGGLVIKPYVIQYTEEKIRKDINGKALKDENGLVLTDEIDKADIEFDFTYADGFYPLAFNGSGDITEAAFIQRIFDKDITYTRLEHHKYIEREHKVIVNNTAYKSTARGGVDDLGQAIPLKQIPEWADIKPTTEILHANGLMFAYFKMPEANNIDMYSPLGVSGFDKAKKLIKDADMQYSSLLWEYEGGEMAIDIDRDALREYYAIDNQGNQVLKSGMPRKQQRLYRSVELTAEGDTYNQFAPTLRDNSYIMGLNTILMRIEDVTGLSRGTISEVDTTEARTATELRILKQRSYQSNHEIQKAIQICLEKVIYVMNALCDLYEITPDGEYETSFEWDDSILVDKEEELGRNITLLHEGVMSKKELRMWYKGETEKQAREALLEVQEENRLAVEDNIITQMDFNQYGLDSTMQQSPDNFRGNN